MLGAGPCVGAHLQDVAWPRDSLLEDLPRVTVRWCSHNPTSSAQFSSQLSPSLPHSLLPTPCDLLLYLRWNDAFARAMTFFFFVCSLFSLGPSFPSISRPRDRSPRLERTDSVTEVTTSDTKLSPAGKMFLRLEKGGLGKQVWGGP